MSIVFLPFFLLPTIALTGFHSRRRSAPPRQRIAPAAVLGVFAYIYMATSIKLVLLFPSVPCVFFQALHILMLSEKYTERYDMTWVDGTCNGSGYTDKLPFTGELTRQEPMLLPFHASTRLVQRFFFCLSAVLSPNQGDLARLQILGSSQPLLLLRIRACFSLTAFFVSRSDNFKTLCTSQRVGRDPSKHVLIVEPMNERRVYIGSMLWLRSPASCRGVIRSTYSEDLLAWYLARLAPAILTFRPPSIVHHRRVRV